MTMGYPLREVFPSSPLALVAAEVRFNDSPRLRQQETIDAISIALEPVLPVQQQVQQQEIQVRSDGLPQVSQTNSRTFKNLSSTAIATLASDRLSLETTTYLHFPEFREQMLSCCRALVDAGVTPAIRRIGLRYIDEIRVPDAVISEIRDWSNWIDASLLGQLSLGPEGGTVVKAEGAVTFRLSGRLGLNFRFAAMPQGVVVSPAALVRPQFDQSQPFFVLDFDGYREFAGPDATLLSVDAVIQTLDAVHDPLGATFQASITDQARDIFRRSEG